MLAGLSEREVEDRVGVQSIVLDIVEEEKQQAAGCRRALESKLLTYQPKKTRQIKGYR